MAREELNINKVSTDEVIQQLKNDLDTAMTNYKAGNITNYLDNWHKITDDPVILSIVREGLKVDFETQPDFHASKQSKLSHEDSQAINKEVSKLLKKGVISKCQAEVNDFISPIFTREKRDGTLRMILNLKRLNCHVTYNHFKMESLENVLSIIRPDVWMASVDLKDAFYSIPLHSEHHKYFKFIWDKQLYQYVAMPNGYSEAMRVFTKILKPPFSHLRAQGFLSVVFVDDTYLQGDTYAQCLSNVQTTIDTLQNLGFTIHAEKSILEPKQEIEFLGFVINSNNMCVSLSERKTNGLIHKINNFKSLEIQTIRQLASVIGSLLSTFPAVPNGPLHYRNLERFKIQQLKANKGNFEAKIHSMPIECDQELAWWVANIKSSFRKIEIPDIDHTIFTDASNLGWGADDGTCPIGGRWAKSEIQQINFLELKAIKLALETYCKSTIYNHIRIMSDNSTAIAYINSKGGTKSPPLDALAADIWEFCNEKGIHISAAHIPGAKNTTADHMSRTFSDQTEWMLHPNILNILVKELGFKPEVDLFASRLNKQLSKYVSWIPDPGCIAVDAFSLSWADIKFYAFPPFSLVGKSIAKIIKENAMGIMIIPLWPSQFWYPMMLKYLVMPPVVLPQTKALLRLPFKPEESHPLLPKLRLAAVLLSGSTYNARNFPLKYLKSF